MIFAGIIGGGVVDNGLGDVLTEQPVLAVAYWNLFPATYSGNCLQIIRSSDSSTQDIGFDGSGVLDTAAIASFCGSSDGKIVTWYDQSGNSTGMTATFTSNRAKIYDGASGLMVTDSTGKIGWNQNGTVYMRTQSIPDGSPLPSLTIMTRVETSDTNAVLLGGNVNTRYFGIGQSGSSSTQVVNDAGTSRVGTHYKNGVDQSIATRGDFYTSFYTGSAVRYCGVSTYSTDTYIEALGVYDGTVGSATSMTSGYFTGYFVAYTDTLDATKIAAVDTYLAANIP